MMAGRHNKRDTELTSMVATMLTRSALMLLVTFQPYAQQNNSPVSCRSFNINHPGPNSAFKAQEILKNWVNQRAANMRGTMSGEHGRGSPLQSSPSPAEVSVTS